MQKRLHSVVETAEFIAGARRILTESERLELVNFLAADPTAGDLMQGTGGARKLRWGAKGKGKRGGARAIPSMVAQMFPCSCWRFSGRANERT
jgi:hypothetical protein